MFDFALDEEVETIRTLLREELRPTCNPGVTIKTGWR